MSDLEIYIASPNGKVALEAASKLSKEYQADRSSVIPGNTPRLLTPAEATAYSDLVKILSRT